MSKSRIRGIVNNTTAARHARRVDTVRQAKDAVNDVHRTEAIDLNERDDDNLSVKDVARPAFRNGISRVEFAPELIQTVDRQKNTEGQSQTIRTLMIDYVTPDLKNSQIFQFNNYENALQSLHAHLQSTDATDAIARKTRRLVKNGLDAVSTLRQSSNGLLNG